MQNDSNEQSFLCPECGSEQAGICCMVSTRFSPDPDDVWSGVLQIIECAHCGFSIPAHLGERWDGLSIEDAQQEWREQYRNRR